MRRAGALRDASSGRSSIPDRETGSRQSNPTLEAAMKTALRVVLLSSFLVLVGCTGQALVGGDSDAGDAATGQKPQCPAGALLCDQACVDPTSDRSCLGSKWRTGCALESWLSSLGVYEPQASTRPRNNL